MGTRHIVLLCILIGAALYCSVTADDEIRPPSKCCFKSEFYQKPKNLSYFITFLKSYSKTDARCALAGVIVVTKKNKNICMDPTLPWVQKIMKALDKPSF